MITTKVTVEIGLLPGAAPLLAARPILLPAVAGKIQARWVYRPRDLSNSSSNKLIVVIIISNHNSDRDSDNRSSNSVNAYSPVIVNNRAGPTTSATPRSRSRSGW